MSPAYNTDKQCPSARASSSSSVFLLWSIYGWSSVVLSQGAGTIDRTLSHRSMLYLTGHRCAANQVDIASPGWSAACLPIHCLLMCPFWCTHLSSIAGVYQPDTRFIRFIRPHRTGATILPTKILFHWPRLSRTKAAPDIKATSCPTAQRPDDSLRRDSTLRNDLIVLTACKYLRLN